MGCLGMELLTDWVFRLMKRFRVILSRILRFRWLVWRCRRRFRMMFLI